MTHTYTQSCIARAAEFIASELQDDRAPALEDIAAAAGLSKYHFHRLYTLVTGETCQETIARLRVAKAAHALKDPDMTITQAAMAAGYGSSQAFAKTVRRMLSSTASTLKSEPERLAAAIETLVIPKTKDGEQQPELAVQLASFEPFEVIVTSTEGTYPTLNAVYWSLFEAAGDPAAVEAILGFPHDSIAAPYTDGLRFDCGLKLEALPPSLPDTISTTQVHGGLFLLTRHVGSYDGLPDAVDRLYLACLADPDVRLADQSCIFHYLDDPEDTAEDALRTDIYLPLDSQAQTQGASS